MRKSNRRKMDGENGHNVWRSYSDMMSGLLLLFVLIMAVYLMQAQRNYTEKLAEQAKQMKTQEELDKAQDDLNKAQDDLDKAWSTVEEQESELEKKEMTLAEQAATLEELQKLLEQQKKEADEKSAQLNTKESEIDAYKETVEAQGEKLKTQEEELNAWQEKLADANAQMEDQQRRIEQIIGVKAELIKALDEEFKANNINVQIDTQTGAILLDSSVLFEFNKYELTDVGYRILGEVLPIYCKVLLDDRYSDNVAEIIVDGYTDMEGDYITNLTLSQQRAFAVSEYLLSNMYGFLTEEECRTLEGKLSTNGKSMSNLIYNPDGSVNNDASRRVEVKFRLKDEEMLTELQSLLEQTSLVDVSIEG